MKIMYALVLTILLYVGLLVYFLYNMFQPKEPKIVAENYKYVYCIMITGKDDCRISLARKAIQNFLEQTYEYKKLIIINHNSTSVLQNNSSIPDVHEYYVSKDSLTLGDLRNIALQLVPPNAYWTVWDDDDYRDPKYLTTLHFHANKNNADVVLFTNRLEVNVNTGLIWHMHLKHGFVFVFAKQDSRIKYLSKDSMEDVTLIDQFKKLGKSFFVFDNDPTLYVRLVHNNNTSLYVNKHKTMLNLSSPDSNYHELHATPKETEYAAKIISTYYKSIPCLTNHSTK